MWRKTFSYINIGGIYIIEFTLMIILSIGFISFFLKKRPTFYFPTNKKVKISIFLAFLFIFYNLIRAILSSSINPKGLIPGIYPIIYIVLVLLSQNSEEKVRSAVYKVMNIFYVYCFLVYIINSVLVAPFFGDIEAPGWTYIYGVGMASSLLLVRNSVVSLLLFGVTFVLALISFERASFVNFLFSVSFIFFSFSRLSKIYFLKSVIIKILSSTILFIFLSPVLINFFFDLEVIRFEITPSNIINFFYSIFSSEIDLSSGFGGLSGTRDHRLEMWSAIVSKVFESPITTFFGFGYKGEVLDILQVSFRAPHNGFVTILYRGGLIGLFTYLFFLFSLLYIFYSFVRSGINYKDKEVAFWAIILLGAFIGDASTGTIIDSPFTSFLFYAQMGILVVVSNKFLN